ncbi:MAG: M48 family metalloprotease [Xanthomonadales bacterium]|nr:M48 family metalloprotease [Gammaproteobacteria bacterium]NNL96276.1 M48 family metalloprotease [Xanthomonadales bacterium]
MRFLRQFAAPVLIGLLGTAPAAAGPTGKEIFEGVISSTPIYDDQELAEYVGSLVAQVVSVSELKDEKFTFTLLDDPAVNAFATRDNYVYVNRGLLHYVRNEAQLVSVLAHEVGHITKGHVTDLEDEAKGAQFLAALAAMLSGSAEVYEAGMAYANSLVKSHGRANELEADAAGAEYMVRLGYDTDAMIEMLSTMKDMESLQKRRAAAQGATRQTYHGIFASHPRNDSRLRNAVGKAGKVDPKQARDDGDERYRKMTEGLVWGENFQDKEKKASRWEDLNARVRFDYPDDWTHRPDGRAVVGTPEDKSALLAMEPMARTAQEPEEYLYNYLNSPQLVDSKSIEPAGLKGFTGILKGEDGKSDKRIAVVYYRMGAYVFTGEVEDPASFADMDSQFLASIETFRPISNRELRGRSPKRIHYVKATSATTFDKLAENLKLTSSEAEDLRLINGYYPSGEPEPGEWIKIIKQ